MPVQYRMPQIEILFSKSLSPEGCASGAGFISSQSRHDPMVLSQAVESVWRESAEYRCGTILICFQVPHTELSEELTSPGGSPEGLHIIDASGRALADGSAQGEHVRVIDGPQDLETLYNELVRVLAEYPFGSAALLIDNLAHSMRNMSQDYIRKFMMVLMYLFRESGVVLDNFVVIESTTQGYATLSNIASPTLEFMAY